MTPHSEHNQYALGNTPAEHDRLSWQAERFDPFTEKFFRDAGIRTGQRVLDLGSGAGHVAMLAARIVGPTGAVVGVERDAGSIALARARVAGAGLRNVTFIQSDVNEILRSDPFDAALGRFILMFQPDPTHVVRSLARLVRPGAVIAFHEVSWAAFLKRSAQLPLCGAGAALIHETFQRTGANTEMGPALPVVFQNAGLPKPAMTTQLLLGNASDLTTWIVDILQVLRPQFEQLGLSLDQLGEFTTLPGRLLMELEAANDIVGGPDLVGGSAFMPE
jgi:SAM-dependent methyltransferase